MVQCWSAAWAILLLKILSAVICPALAECESHFVELATNDCDCQRSSVTFECRFLGGTATVFQGSALSCDATSNEVSLLHYRFNTSSGTSGSCNGGMIVAQSLRVDSNCYTSTINVTFISPSLIGGMIKCFKDDGLASTLIDTVSISAEPGIKAPLSPTDVTWEVGHTGITTDILFTWSASATNCSSLQYNIFQVNCGGCPMFSTNTNVSCIDVPTNDSERVCMFSLQAVACVNVTSNWSDALQIQIESEHNIVPFNGLSQVAGCFCPGETVTYQCAVPSGTAATMWRGSAFNCTNNAIILRHSQYTSGNSSGDCNDCNILGQGLYVANYSYVSILNVTVNSDYAYYKNKTIECVYSDGLRLIPIGRIMMNTSLPAEPIRSPADIRVSDISPTFITFSWSAVASDCHNVKYNLHAENCGICPFATFHTAVSCNNPIIDGRVCHFRVKSVVCGITAEDFSNLVTVTLRLPKVQNVTVIPHYSRMNVNTSDILSTVTVEFLREPDYLPSYFNNHSFFTISYSDSVLSGSSCGGEVIIPVSSCDSHSVCRHVLQIPSFTCPPITDVVVSVSAGNLFGSGPQSRKIIAGDVTSFVSINFYSNISSFVCTFLNDVIEQESSNKSCNIRYGPGDDCESLILSNGANSPSNTVVVGILIQPVIEARYCFSATANNGTYTVGVTGIINLACDPLLLGDNTSLPQNISCDPPYHSLGISNGIACYNETKSGSIAVYFCLKCGFTNIKGYSTRTCLLNGSWTGSIPQCNCSDDIVIHNVVDNNDTCIPNVTGIVLTNFSDYNPGNIMKSPLFFGVTTTSGALCVSIIIGTVMLIGLIASCASKRKLQLELQRLKETMYPIYEDIDLNTDKNVAYIQNTVNICESNYIDIP